MLKSADEVGTRLDEIGGKIADLDITIDKLTNEADKAIFTLDHYAHVTSDMQKNTTSIVTNYITDILGK